VVDVAEAVVVVVVVEEIVQRVAAETGNNRSIWK
jgi:hypothetical protein